jgi:hypothetical protein
MQTIKVRVHYSAAIVRFFFPSWVAGVTVGNRIFFRRRRELVSRRLLNHELIHVCQYADRGIDRGFFRKTVIDDVLFFLAHYYISEKSYRERPEEIEAYTYEADFDYIARRWPNYNLVIEE